MKRGFVGWLVGWLALWLWLWARFYKSMRACVVLDG